MGPAIGAHRRRWGQPFVAHRRRWGQPSDVHRTLMRPAIAALTARSAIGAHKILVSHAVRRSQRGCHHGAHRILVWPAIVALTARPAIAALTMFNNNKNPLKNESPFLA